MRRWLPLLLAASMGAPILAGTIEVKVVGPGGGAVAGATVIVDRQLTPMEGFPSPEARSATSGPDGGATFSDIPAGSWRVRADFPLATALVSPRELTPVTLIRDDAAASVLLQAALGDRIRLRVAGSDPGVAGTAILLKEQFGRSATLTMGPDGRGEAIVPAGRWVVLVPARGLAETSSFEADGRSIDPSHPLVTSGSGSVIELLWRFRGWGKVMGRVTFDGPAPDTQVFVAAERTGVEGGPSVTFAPSRYEELRPDGGFSLALDEGKWRVHLGGHALLEVEPPEVEVEIRTGSEVAVAFVAKTRERAQESRARLVVQVLTPDGQPCDRADVVVRRLIDGLPAPRNAMATPIGPGKFEATLDAVGTWRIEAGHPDWVWTSLAVKHDDPKRTEPLEATVTLRRGATIEIGTAKSPAGAPPARVNARVVGEVDDGGETVSRSSYWRDATTDAQGQALLRGLMPRRWQVEASGSSSWRYRLRIGDAPPASKVELDLAESDVAKIEVVPEASAAVKAELVCDDGGPIGGLATLLAHSVDRPEAEPVTLMAGPTFDAAAPLTLGPIDPGRWRFEFETSGLARTTWAPGTEIPADAETYTLEADGVPKDLGTIRVDCAPAARLAVFIDDPRGADPENVPSPDLRLARLDGRYRENDDAPWQPLKGLSVAASKDAMYVHKLPEGEGTVEFTIRHPHLLDEPFAVATLRGKRYRGGLHQAIAEAPGLGGAIVYSGAKRLKLVPRPEGVMRASTGQGAGNGGFVVKPGAPSAPVPGDLEPRIVPIDPDWGAAVSIAPGVYDVHACGEPDPDCERVEKLWSGIRVQAGSTIELR
jgi:hypothetical protein